jgi:hypothetical protein
MARPRSVIAALALALSASGAFAQARPQSTRMSCAQAAGFVFSRGGVVLGTGGHTYDRFVRDRSFCQITEVLRPAYAPTLDAPACFVGYTCVEPTGRFWDD